MCSMPRAPRIHYPGAVYHAMARGVDGREIFSDDQDRHHFMRILTHVFREMDAQRLAYCLMGNHFHLAVKVGITQLSILMQRILTSYSLSFNHRHVRTGHLFQARYKAVICLDNAYLAALIRYIHGNPVRAGLTKSPDLWRWSSYAEYIRSEKDGMIKSDGDLPTINIPDESSFNPWPITPKLSGSSSRRVGEIGVKSAVLSTKK